MWGKAEAVTDKGRDRQGAGIREGLCVPVISSRSEGAGLPFSCKNRKNLSVAEGLLQYSEGGGGGENLFLFLFVAHPLSKQLPGSCSSLAGKASSKSVLGLWRGEPHRGKLGTWGRGR